MAEYYLMSQLPSLDEITENTPIPITVERFLELCKRSLKEKTYNELSELSLVPDKTYKKSSSAVVESWNEGERNLRLALAKLRADKMNKSFETDNNYLPAALVQVARTAVEMDSPLEAEKFLNSYRLEFLETLRPMDIFSEETVFYYWLKLKLLLRIRQFNADDGKSAYRNIYDSILNGTDLEA